MSIRVKLVSFSPWLCVRADFLGHVMRTRMCVRCFCAQLLGAQAAAAFSPPPRPAQPVCQPHSCCGDAGHASCLQARAAPPQSAFADSARRGLSRACGGARGAAQHALRGVMTTDCERAACNSRHAYTGSRAAHLSVHHHGCAGTASTEYTSPQSTAYTSPPAPVHHRPVPRLFPRARRHRARARRARAVRHALAAATGASSAPLSAVPRLHRRRSRWRRSRSRSRNEL
jgi:hypothetical protein